MDYSIPVKNSGYRFYIGLISQANENVFVSSPTLAAGDAMISRDGGALVAIATLPSVVPAAGPVVQVDLSAAEMNADSVVVVFHDVAGAQWRDLLISLSPANASLAASFAAVIAAMPITAGSGTIAHTYTVTSSVDATPVAEVQVSVSTDVAGANIVAAGYTDSFGQIIFYLDPGTYYFWRSKDRWTFANPDTEVVA